MVFNLAKAGVMHSDEPTYVFERGTSWVPKFEISRSCIREYKGNRYMVTVIERHPLEHERAARRD